MSETAAPDTVLQITGAGAGAWAQQRSARGTGGVPTARVAARTDEECVE